MIDRELLEAAARAVGLQITGWPQPDYATVRDESGKTFGWSPLVLDSDALRLSVALRMNVFHASCKVYAVDEDGDIEVSEGHERDPLAATRRAIVRAAAAMAKDKP